MYSFLFIADAGDLKEKLLLNSHIDDPVPWSTNKRYFLTNKDTFSHIPEEVDTLISKAYFGEWLQFFELPQLQSLKSISIGSFSGVNVSKFILKGYSSLETLFIDQECFGKDLQVTSPDREFRLVECPKLRSIKLGYRCFSDYSVCELRDLPSLQTIDFGYWCFTTLPVFELRSRSEEKHVNRFAVVGEFQNQLIRYVRYKKGGD